MTHIMSRVIRAFQRVQIKNAVWEIQKLQEEKSWLIRGLTIQKDLQRGTWLLEFTQHQNIRIFLLIRFYVKLILLIWNRQELYQNQNEPKNYPKNIPIKVYPHGKKLSNFSSWCSYLLVLLLLTRPVMISINKLLIWLWVIPGLLCVCATLL